jgi:hypothetical protein
MRHLILAFLTSLLLAGAACSQQASADSTTIPLDYNDGPYVFWQNDTTAIVFYICGDTLSKHTFYASDTLRFDGLCSDSTETYIISTGPAAIEPFVIDGVPKILAVSDIHGEYEYFTDILQRSEVIDSALNWSWGDGHLVIVGDVFDRGDKVTECLWLIYRLEQQAKRFGGRVHFILGNHELMVLQGDNRYIHDRYLKGIARKSRIKHEDLYGPDMELGRWLRSKQTAIRLNGILFVHGGISPQFVEDGWTLSHINEQVREKIGLRSSQIAFDDNAKLLFGSQGPFWYRGYHYAMEDRYEQATSAEVGNILNFYGANNIVVGHTDNGVIVTLYDKTIYDIDVDFEELASLHALLWQDNKFFKVTGAGPAQPID